MKCAAVILAAGAARRWGGGPKALARWRGRPLIDHVAAVAVAAGCAPVYRVLGAHRAEIEAGSLANGVRTVFNAEWEAGLGTSIACAARALLRDPAAERCDGLLILLCDQPLVDAALLRELMAEPGRSGRGVVFSDHGGGVSGPPAFVARRYWAELAELRGDAGARHVARAHPEDVAFVPAPNAREDLDTPEDYERLLKTPEASDPS